MLKVGSKFDSKRLSCKSSEDTQKYPKMFQSCSKLHPNSLDFAQNILALELSRFRYDSKMFEIFFCVDKCLRSGFKLF